MKIFNINLAQKKISYLPKYNNLAPLRRDTISFGCSTLTFKGAPLPKEFAYCAAQKDREVEAISAVLNNALKNSEFPNEEELSIITGFDINIIKLRLSTNKKLRALQNRLKVKRLIEARQRKETSVIYAQKFFEKVKTSRQKLTESEMAFYLGLKKDELLQLVNEYPNLSSLYKKIVLQTKNYPLLEKRTQKSKISSCLKYGSSNNNYANISEKTGFSHEIIRFVFNEDAELFSIATDKGIFPPEIYSKEEIEMQTRQLMNIMINSIKYQKQPDIEALAKKVDLLPAVVKMRIDTNEALKETYQRMLGIDAADEDWV